jgi:hypothetical protein
VDRLPEIVSQMMKPALFVVDLPFRPQGQFEAEKGGRTSARRVGIWTFQMPPRLLLLAGRADFAARLEFEIEAMADMAWRGADDGRDNRGPVATPADHFFRYLRTVR